MEVNNTFTEVTVFKKTGSYSDCLVAIGMADLLSSLPTRNGHLRQVTIKDNGESFVLEVSPPASEEDFNQWNIGSGYPYIQVKKDDEDRPTFNVIDYEAAREQEKVYREYQKVVGKKSKTVTTQLETQGLEGPPPPRADLSVLKTYNSMRMGSNSYNALHKALREVKNSREMVMAKLGVIQPSQRYATEEKKLQKAVSTLQLFNPTAGKGTHRPKPDSSSAGGFPDKLVDWFEEWMKFRALHQAVLTYPVGDDTKVMVIAPGDIYIQEVEYLRKRLLSKRLYGSVWLEILAVFEIVRGLIDHSKEMSGEKGSLSYFYENTPNQLIKGFYNTYFKSLGTASAVMNISFLGLPGWFPISSPSDAEDWMDILEEHERCLKSLDESHSSDIPVLMLYRDFLSTGRLELALEFFPMYGIHFMQRKAQNKWVDAFTTKNLGRLFMSYDLQDIVLNKGFQNVAKAIRRSTIYAQIRKSKTGRSPFEIQYGLAQDWKRKARFKDQFIAELADFVQRYNAESARHMELGKEPRELVSTQDLSDIISLIEKNNSSELVCMLLLAYGYAKETKEQE